MAEIVGGGRPVNDAERRVIAYLRDHAPADWLLLHNVEVPRRDDVFEVDLLVVTGHSLVVIDVKGTRGRIEVSGMRWFPSRSPAFGSPAMKLRGTARAIKGLLVDKHKELERVYVDSLVVLTAPDAELVDPDGRDRANVVGLDALIPALQDPSRVRRGCTRDASPYRGWILDALNAMVRSSNAAPRYGHWEVEEQLGGDARVTEYRAFNATLPGSETVLLRVYQADPLADAASRAAELQRIANAYQSLARIPPHPNVVRPRDFFAIDDESRFVLVLDDVHGEALHLRRRVHVGVVRDMLAGLAHAHAHGVVHRALTPASVLVTDDGRAMLTGFDYAKPGPRAYTVANELGNVLDAQYVAPESRDRPDLMTAASDVYAAGVIARRHLADPPAIVDRMLEESPSRRPTAAEALAALESRPIPRRSWFHRLLRR
ncbi:NERD domain-containing protein kinase family protein [Thermoactinospora rubra]|uniref:NERD domain-containing protein kinase family protein n=1 Tax=Thermoactinospora rubra TaxID=1088767 RepID=UPI000A115D50|nr:NERD domain-containing protein kinase family protein [Thermoactinospora rubra]